jgi:ribosomal protein S18 acetylase RimI-like enzyme
VGSPDYQIQPIDEANLEALFAYLEDQMRDNGRDGVPLFMPQSRQAPAMVPEKVASFRAGLSVPVGAPGWRRAWAALNSSGRIAGHVDLRAHPDPCTAHRALLGLGVHRAHRRRGLGAHLVRHAESWALQETELAWIDLSFLDGNVPARRLYRALGYQETAIIEDMFRIDGASIGDVSMTKRLRS